MSTVQTVILHTSSGCVISVGPDSGSATLHCLRVLLTNQTLPRVSARSDASNPEHVVLTANNHADTHTALSCAVIQQLLGQTDRKMMIIQLLICSPSFQPPGNECATFFNKNINDPHEAKNSHKRERIHSNAYHCDCLQPRDKMAINKRCSGSRRGDNMHSYLHVCMFICAWQTPARSGMHSPLSQGVKLLDGSAHTQSDSCAT